MVIGAIRGADGRRQLLRLGLRGHWRQRFAALLQRIAALAVSIQLWRSLPTTKKILRPSPGNRASPASNQTYCQRSNEVFGLSRGDLSEAECRLLEPPLPPERGRKSRPAFDNRQIVNGILRRALVQFASATSS